MKERLSKSIKRLEKLDLIKKRKDNQKNLNAYEIKVFRQLRDKYDLSVEKNDNISDDKGENELSEEAKLTLSRIKKGEKFSL